MDNRDPQLILMEREAIEDILKKLESGQIQCMEPEAV